MDIDKPIEKMDIDDVDPTASTSGNLRKQQQILAKNAIPSVTISLHPLVLMNVAEHWTRFRAQEGAARPVYGALIGKQDGRKIEVYNSFELRYETIDGDVVINRDYYNTKEEQCKLNEKEPFITPTDQSLSFLRQASFQRFGFPRMVHNSSAADRATHQNSPSNLSNQ
jgi:hypothetical protein